MKRRYIGFLALVLSFVLLAAVLPGAAAETAGEPQANDPDRVPERIEVPEEDASDGKRAPEVFLSETLPSSEKDAAGSTAASDGTRRIDNSALRLGVNWYSINTPGETVYRPFTIPMSGYYWFASTAAYNESGLAVYDSFGTLTNSAMEEIASDDDGGDGLFFSIRNAGYFDAGTLVYLGVRLYDASETGTIPVKIDYPYWYDDTLQPGASVYSASTAGGIWYHRFTPTESGIYRVYSLGDSDTVGALLNSGLGEILYDDDTGENSNFFYRYWMNADQAYYIGAKFYDNSKTGNITVVIEKEGAAFDPEIVWDGSDVSFRGSTPYVIANGKAQTPRFTVRNKADGTTVDPSEYAVTYLENTKAGTGYAQVTFSGSHSGSILGWFKIYLPATKTTSVANTANGIKISWAAVDGAAGYVIYRRAWSSTTGGWTTFERWNNTTARSWTDTNVYAGTRYQYGIKAYFAKRTDPVSGASIGGNVGDNYNLGMVGPLKTTVRITSRTLKSLTAGSKKITVNWAPSSVFTGYQIKYATNAAFTENVKSVWVGNPKTSSIDIGSLKNGTRYYVCVRSYHNFEGVQYYGAWSNVLSVKPGSGQFASLAKYRALVVGETDYASANDLIGSVNDARAVTGMLKGLANKFTCTKLENATKTQILNGIQSALSGATDEDVSLFYFAGHGANFGGNATYQGALCTVEGNYITFSELAEALSGVKGRVIVIISSCFSGNAIATSDGADGETIDPEAYNQAIIDAFSGYYLDGEPAQSGTRAGELRQSKFIVLTTAAADEVGWEGVWDRDTAYVDGTWYRGHAFGTAFLKGMGCTYPNGAYTGSTPADQNKNKQITLKELYDYTYSTVYNWTKDLMNDGEKSPAHVKYYGPGSEILFRR